MKYNSANIRIKEAEEILNKIILEYNEPNDEIEKDTYRFIQRLKSIPDRIANDFLKSLNPPLKIIEKNKIYYQGFEKQKIKQSTHPEKIEMISFETKFTKKNKHLRENPIVLYFFTLRDLDEHDTSYNLYDNIYSGKGSQKVTTRKFFFDIVDFLLLNNGGRILLNNGRPLELNSSRNDSFLETFKLQKLTPNKKKALQTKLTTTEAKLILEEFLKIMKNFVSSCESIR